MSDNIQFLRASARQPVPWKNGGGVTREVARDSRGGTGADFDWRVSVAEVALAGPFSHFPGYRRLIAIIAGQGMGFVTAAGEKMLTPRHAHAFSGEDDVSATLPFGPVSDLNLIYRPAAIEGSMSFGNGARTWRPDPQARVILLNVGAAPLRGSANGKPWTLEALDGVIATSEIAVEPGGTYAAIEIRPLSSCRRPAACPRPTA